MASEESSLGFARSHALVVGVNAYDPARGVAPLNNAVADAEAVASALMRHQGFAAQLLVDAACGDLRTALRDLVARVAAEDRVVVYFAGHGLWRDDDGGPAGFLLLRDAMTRDPTSFVAMREVRELLAALRCRHVLVVLDCCFAGAFRSIATRDVRTAAAVSRQRFQRYVEAAAWQVITSTGPDQLALDGLGERGGAVAGHSPFATALLRGLAGEADLNGDGLITATELYLYIRDQVEDAGERSRAVQSPGLFPLPQHDCGEFVFRTPGRPLRLPAAEQLTLDWNPYRGLLPFDEGHGEMFFGRARAAIGLAKVVLQRPLTVVTGASGTGKSSLVRAGLLPALRRRAAAARPGRTWRVLGPLRPRDAIGEPFPAAAPPDGITVVVIDQLEELLTWHGDRARGLMATLAQWITGRPDGVRVIVTVRADFEPLLEDGPLAPWWKAGRYVVPPLSLDELRAAIERPADLRDLHFEPSRLVEQIATEVAQMPGALPLLSFTLSELYRIYCERGEDDRALREADYRALGGVAGAVTQRADAELAALDRLDPRYRTTVRNLMLRATDEIGGERARRRVPRSELVYAAADENDRIGRALARYVDARLLVAEASFAEPAHDVLIRGWPQMLRWLEQAAAQRPLVRVVTTAAAEWSVRRDPRDLWHANPRLDQLAALAAGADHPLNAVELEFARRSMARRRAGRIRRTATVAVVIGVLAAVAAIARVQRSRAIEARDAEARSRDRAENLVDYMAYDLPDQLQAVGQPDAMHGIADRIDAYYQSLRKETSPLDRAQQRRMVAGNSAMGNIWLEQDKPATAREAFEASLQDTERLAGELPGDPTVQRDLYVDHMGFGAVAMARDDWATAGEELTRARGIIEALLATRPDDPRWRLDRAQVLVRQFQLAQRTGDPRARATAQQAIDELEAIVGKAPANQEAIVALSRSYRALIALMDAETEGTAKAKAGVRIEALLKMLPTDHFDARILDERSLETIDAAETRALVAIRQALAIPDLASKHELVTGLQKLFDTSELALRDACADRRMLARLAPRNLSWQREWFNCQLMVAEMQLVLGDGRAAERSAVDAWRAQQEVATAFPGVPDVARDGGLVLDLAAINQRQLGNFDDAQQLFRRSLDLARTRSRTDTSVAASADLALSLANLAEVEVDRGQFADAGAEIDEALKLCAGAQLASCVSVRAVAEDLPRAPPAIALVMRFRVTGVTGLAGRVEVGASCVAYLRPAPRRAEDRCARGVLSCNGWRVLGSDLSMGLIDVGRTQCAASRLELATGRLHIAATGLIGSYTIDATAVSPGH